MKTIKILLVLLVFTSVLVGCKKEESPPTQAEKGMEREGLSLPKDNLSEAVKAVEDLQALGIE